MTALFHPLAKPVAKWVGWRRVARTAGLLSLLLAGAPQAETAASFKPPLSVYDSPEAKALSRRLLDQAKTTPPGPSIEDKRAYYDRINSDRAERMRKLYPVRIHAETIGGVASDVVEPAQGVAAANAKRVLINLHGGAFLWGAHSGTLVESIPVAALGRIKVIGVDYRQGPEHVFPAASDDVEAVYKALLKQYKPQDIGIYGCSAGGFLSGQVVARLIEKNIPLPGAVGLFCSGLVAPDGDSAYAAPVLSGEPMPTAAQKLGDLPYFKGANPTDPLVLPGNSPALLAKFPPTLLISGTRDFALSSTIHSHTLLRQAGVDAELYVWEGMWHSFFSDPEMPESRQAYDTMVRFFNRHLGGTRGAGKH